MHMPNDPLESNLGTREERVQAYLEMMDVGSELALSGIMQRLQCDRREAILLLERSYERHDREKLEGWARAAKLISNAL